MPTYCYTHKEDTVERVFPIGKAPKEIQIGKTVFRRDYSAEPKGIPHHIEHVSKGSPWPMTCYASGVNASDAQQLRDYFTKAGVPTEVTKEGDPIYRNAVHRKKALKCRGIFDKSSFN